MTYFGPENMIFFHHGLFIRWFPEMGVAHKWLVYNGKNLLSMDDLGVPPVQETTI